MATFFVVYQEQRTGLQPAVGSEWESVKTADVPKTAKVWKVETSQAGAAGILEAQQAVGHWQPGDIVGTPVVVTEAAWKTS